VLLKFIYENQDYPYSFDTDPDPEFRLNTDPDPDPIWIQGFTDQKLEKNYN
jgi:hypothetical protein